MFLLDNDDDDDDDDYDNDNAENLQYWSKRVREWFNCHQISVI